MDGPHMVAIGIALLTIAGMIARPWGTAEWLWAVAGALAEIGFGAIAGSAAWTAVAGGADVYAFLVGILLLAEGARAQGVFGWLAGRAAELAGGSRFGALLLCYAAGAVVTATLSNDTAIIVLTPAALALGRRIGGSMLPYLFAIAFVANAASYALPTGNPANLLLYGHGLPALGPWLAVYGLSASAAILVTFGVTAWMSRAELSGPAAPAGDRPRSTPGSRLALRLLALSACALVAVSALGLPLGYAALGLGIACTAILGLVDRGSVREVARGTAWSVVPLVAGLLVIVAALERAGATAFARSGLDLAAGLPRWLGREVAGFATMLVANAANNLPAAVFAGRAIAGPSVHSLAHAVVVGIDLGPNLSLSGSLATLLWLLALRREGVAMTPGGFFLRGALVTLPALAVALILVR